MPNPNTERPPVLVVLETVPGTFCTSRLGVESPAPRHTWNVLAPKSLHPPPLPETWWKEASWSLQSLFFLSTKPIHIAQKLAFSEKKSGPLLILFYLHGIQGSLTKKKQHFEMKSLLSKTVVSLGPSSTFSVEYQTVWPENRNFDLESLSYEEGVLLGLAITVPTARLHKRITPRLRNEQMHFWSLASTKDKAPTKGILLEF